MKTFIDRLFYGNYWLGSKVSSFPFINAVATFGITVYLFILWLTLFVNLFLSFQVDENDQLTFFSVYILIGLILNFVFLYYTNHYYKRSLNFLRAKRKFLELKLVWKLLYGLSSFITVALIFLLSFFMR